MDAWAGYMAGIITAIVVNYFLNKRKTTIIFWKDTVCTIVLFMILKVILIKMGVCPY